METYQRRDALIEKREEAKRLAELNQKKLKNQMEELIKGNKRGNQEEEEQERAEIQAFFDT